MAIPADLREYMDGWLQALAQRRGPPELRDDYQLTHRYRGNDVVLSERRPAWNGIGEWTELKIARFVYAPEMGQWRLYWRDSTERWHLYDDLPPTGRVLTLIAEVHFDPAGIFWG